MLSWVLNDKGAYVSNFIQGSDDIERVNVLKNQKYILAIWKGDRFLVFNLDYVIFKKERKYLLVFLSIMQGCGGW